MGVPDYAPRITRPIMRRQLSVQLHPVHRTASLLTVRENVLPQQKCLEELLFLLRAPGRSDDAQHRPNVGPEEQETAEALSSRCVG